MPRVQESDVTEIFNTTLDSSALSTWIEIANEVVDDISDAGMDDADRLKKIEKLLAAHFASTQDRRVDKESGGGKTPSITFSGDTGMHLDATQYGQQAKMLDTTNTLKNRRKPTASIDVPKTRE